DVPPLGHSTRFRVLVNAPAGATDGAASPNDAGAFAMFGRHIMQGPITFAVPISGALAALRANNQLVAGAPLNIRVVPETAALPSVTMGHGLGGAAEVASIVVEAH